MDRPAKSGEKDQACQNKDASEAFHDLYSEERGAQIAGRKRRDCPQIGEGKRESTKPRTGLLPEQNSRDGGRASIADSPGSGVRESAEEKSLLERMPVSQVSLDAFTKEHKINIRHENGMLSYSIDANGKTTDLFKTTATEYGLRDAFYRLESLSQNLQKQLEVDYGVRFAKAGEPVDYQRASSDGQAQPRMVAAVNAEYYQLVGIKSALAKSNPSSLLGQGEKPVKIYFLAEKVIQDKVGISSYQYDRYSNPSIYFMPSVNGITKTTEADLSPTEKRLPHSDTKRPESMEGAMLSAMGMHQFAKQGFASTIEGQMTVSRWGWTPNMDFRSSSRAEWLLMGKGGDSDGRNSTYLPSSNGIDLIWTRTKPEGGTVDSKGKKAPAAQAEKLSSADLRDRALVKPPTRNFESPAQEFGESVKLLRLGEASRKELIRQSQILYDAAKASDQKEIDKYYGKDQDGTPDGTSRYIRSASGALVRNTDANRLELSNFEVISLYPDLRPKK